MRIEGNEERGSENEWAAKDLSEEWELPASGCHWQRPRLGFGRMDMARWIYTQQMCKQMPVKQAQHYIVKYGLLWNGRVIRRNYHNYSPYKGCLHNFYRRMQSVFGTKNQQKHLCLSVEVMSLIWHTVDFQIIAKKGVGKQLKAECPNDSQRDVNEINNSVNSSTKK